MEGKIDLFRIFSYVPVSAAIALYILMQQEQMQTNQGLGVLLSGIPYAIFFILFIFTPSAILTIMGLLRFARLKRRGLSVRSTVVSTAIAALPLLFLILAALVSLVMIITLPLLA